MKTIYLLKDLARASGHSVDTVKYYLKEGLVREFGRGPDTRYRYFDDETVTQLNKIRGLKKEGKSLREIKELLKV